jgi:hypothetical protein
MNEGMKNTRTDNNTTQLTLENLEAIPPAYGAVILNKEKFIEILIEIDAPRDLTSIKNKIIMLKDTIINRKNDREGVLNIDANGDTISLRKDVLISELNQILESQTVEIAIEKNEKGALEYTKHAF